MEGSDAEKRRGHVDQEVEFVDKKSGKSNSEEW